MSNLSCPFCSSNPIEYGRDLACSNHDCPIGHKWIPKEKWNTRAGLRLAAYAVVSERGGIAKMAISKQAAEGKAIQRREHGNGMGFAVRPLYLVD